MQIYLDKKDNIKVYLFTFYNHIFAISILRRGREKLRSLANGGQVVLHLGWREALEAILVADANLDVVRSHLAFEALLQSQDGRLDGILQFEIFAVSIWSQQEDVSLELEKHSYTGLPLLEERLAIDVILAQRSCFPSKECPLKMKT